MAPRSTKPPAVRARGIAGVISHVRADGWDADVPPGDEGAATSPKVSLSSLTCAESDGEPILVQLGTDGALATVTGLMAQSLATQAAERAAADDVGPLRALLHLADFGIALLDTSGAVIFVNEHAQDLFEAGTVLTLRRDRLQCAVTASRQSFEQALDAHCDAAGQRRPAPASILKIPHPRGHGATLLKIQQLALNTREETGPWVVVFIFDTVHRRNNRQDTLRELYGLSSAEAKVAFRLADGCDIPEIAERMNIATNTVRAHLRSAYSKTGTKKQAQLVARICRDLLALESLLR